MSVATTNNRVEAEGNGATTAFPVSFVFNDASDLKVYKDGTLQTLTTHYTVSGGDGFTGTVTFLAAPANGLPIIILRDPPRTQATSFRNQGRFFAEVHEAAFDKLTMLVQRVGDLLGRSAVLPDTVASTVDPTLPTPVAGRAIIWNSGATGLANSSSSFDNIVSDAAASAAAAATSATAAETARTAAELAETNAETAEANAEIAEANAEAAAAAAQAAADSIGFRDVIFLTSADSPYTVAQATSGKLLSIDTSGGAVTVNLPTIATLTLPYTVGIKKTTGDGNAVTINRGGTDTFDDGSTSKTLSGVAGTTLIPDTDPSPDKWSASDWGAASGQQKKQQFVGGVDFTAGVTTTLTVTESPIPSSKDALEVFFDGAYQQESEWEYASSTGVITFDVAIPGGTSRVEAIWTTPLAIGTPADGTVTAAKLADGVFNSLTTVTPALLDAVALADASDSGNKKKALIEAVLGLFKGYINDLTLSNNLSDPTNDIDIAAGKCVDSTGVVFMSGGALTKRLDAAWAVGNGNGGLDTGAKANSTPYHIFAIRKDSDSTIDYLFSTSATSPTMPGGYTYKRRIGAVITDGAGTIRPFTQVGDEFVLSTPVLDLDSTTITTSESSATLTVPNGVRVRAHMQVFMSHASAGTDVYIRSPLANDAAPSASAAPLLTIRTVVAGVGCCVPMSLITGADKTIRVRSTASSTTVRVATLGWADTRGRFD